MKTSPKLHSVSSLRGFTLIELLVVVSIIVVLAGLTIGVAGYVQRKSTVTKASAQLALFEKSLQDYKFDAGSFPQEDDEDGLIVYTMLYGDGLGPDLIAGTTDDTEPDGEPDEGATVYLPDLNPIDNPKDLLLVQNRVPVKLIDPWGNAWHYRSGQQQYNAENPDFDLWSDGPDGDPDTGDEIKNW